MTGEQQCVQERAGVKNYEACWQSRLVVLVCSLKLKRLLSQARIYCLFFHRAAIRAEELDTLTAKKYFYALRHDLRVVHYVASKGLCLVYSLYIVSASESSTKNTSPACFRLMVASSSLFDLLEFRGNLFEFLLNTGDGTSARFNTFLELVDSINGLLPFESVTAVLSAHSFAGIANVVLHVFHQNGGLLQAVFQRAGEVHQETEVSAQLLSLHVIFSKLCSVAVAPLRQYAQWDGTDR